MTVSRQSLKGANDKIHSEYSHNHPHTAVQISHIHTHNLFQIILEILNGDICPVMCYSVSFPPGKFESKFTYLYFMYKFVPGS